MSSARARLPESPQCLLLAVLCRDRGYGFFFVSFFYGLRSVVWVVARGVDPTPTRKQRCYLFSMVSGLAWRRDGSFFTEDRAGVSCICASLLLGLPVSGKRYFRFDDYFGAMV